jgi:GNAT superfamily N-acetyltransferase
MTLDVRIRRATESDLPAILAVYKRAGIDGGLLPLEAARSIFSRMASYPDYTLFVAECDERVVGTFALLIMDNLGHLGAPSGIVEDVAVDRNRQGMGVGTAMMEFALARCRERGCYKMALSSNSSREDAHRFYEGLGFRRHGYSFIVDLEPEVHAGCMPHAHL